MHYIVLGGGTSPEREVSLRSARAVQEGLEALGHQVDTIDPRSIGIGDLIEKTVECDGVFPILHGIGGEDGRLQAAFEAEGIPFFGPSVEACRNTFDKVVFKKILEAHGLPTPAWNVVNAKQFDNEPLTKHPFVIKPIRGGSSIDTFIVRTLPFDSSAIKEALGRYGSMLVEELIDGTETTVGVLEQTALPVIEIVPPESGEFDYENKYNGATQELCPPKTVDAATQAELQQLAEQVHTITKCRHLSRTDILIDRDGSYFIIDTNTIPGLTTQSLFPKAALVAGLDWHDLVAKFVSLIS